MQSEDFDSKIKTAADHHHPAYDEQAWDKMEQLLDKHLPQEKKDRRRFLFFLLLFLLLGGSAWLVATKPWAGNKSSITQVKEKEGRSSNQKPINNIKQDEKTDIRINTSTNEKNEIENSAVTTEAGIPEGPTMSVGTNDKPVTINNNSSSVPVAKITTSKTEKPITISIAKTKQRTTFFKAITGTKKKSVPDKQKVTVNDKKQDALTSNKYQQQKDDNDIVPAIVNADIATTNTVTKTGVENISKRADNKDVLTDDSAAMKKDSPADSVQVNKTGEPVVEQPVAKKAKNKKANSFFFSLSAGPDVSFAGTSKLGKTKMITGLGIGYTFKDRLTLRTGFYTGRKIYSASAANYNPPTDFYVYYPYLQKVDADCKVYEIPVLLNYNFGASAKQNWFLSTGLSSLLMKSESYTYFYKYTATGPTLNAKWSVKDQNKHFFSVLTLSGGYQRNLGKSLSLMVEPYIKMPLSGVGYGKVKLNSTGVLFSLGIKPFSGSKKQQR
jgi:hypothetical protein